MKMHILRTIGLLAAAGLSASQSYAAKYVIILHNAAGWQLQGAEKLTIDGKVKIRRVPRPEITQDVYKKLPAEVLGAVPLRLHRSGYLAARSGVTWTPVVPDGASFKGSATAQVLWSGAKVIYQADKGSKDQAFRTADIFAILPAAPSAGEAAVAMLNDESYFKGVGEATPAEAFDERMGMLIGVAAIADAPTQAKLKVMLANAMNAAIQRTGTGSGRVTALTEGLQFATVSERAFAGDAQQAALRNTLRDKRKYLDQRVAIVKAFAAASEWDPLIDKYGDFEQYDDAYEDVRALHDKSFRASETFHKVKAQQLFDEKQCDGALGEMKLAIKRNPTSRELETQYSNMRISCSSESVGTRRELTRAQNLQILNHVTLADSYMTDGKLDDSEAAIVSAEAVYAKDPRVVLMRVKLLRARKQYPQAIEMLNSYDRLPKLTDAEAGEGTLNRTKISYEMTSGRNAARAETAKSETEGDFVGAYRHVKEGLLLDPNDPELLYHGGIDAAITRNPAEARQMWQSYLTASQSLASEGKRRGEVLNQLSDISSTPKPPAGPPNWFSNWNTVPGVMYDTVSLAPNYHPAAIHSSRKQNTSFEWSGGVLSSIKTTSQVPGEAPITIYFDYYPGHKGVRRVSKEAFDDKTDPGLPRMTPDGAMGTGKGTYVALFSNPAVNPYLVEKLTGKRVAVLVAGNPYFQPFVWTGVYAFLAEYDAEGRVKSAKALQGPGKQLDFMWDGNKLMGISERAGEYRREMRYAGDRLIGETVQYRGKNSKIDYKYNGGTLVEADCTEDLSLDSRSHHVMFGN